MSDPVDMISDAPFGTWADTTNATPLANIMAIKAMADAKFGPDAGYAVSAETVRMLVEWERLGAKIRENDARLARQARKRLRRRGIQRRGQRQR